MASISQVGKVWRASVFRKAPDGEVIRKTATFDTKTEAKDWAAAIELGIKAGAEHVTERKTFGQLLEKYRDEVSITKRGEKWERLRIGLILRDELSEVKLSALNETHIAAWRDRRLLSVSPGTVRREWNLLSSACTIAINEWKWLHRHPMKIVRRPAPPRARDRILSDDEINRLLFVLGYTPGTRPTTVTAHVGAALLLAIETAMRAGELCALTWADVDLTTRVARVTGDTHGAGKTQAAIRAVPLSTVAVSVFQNLTVNPEDGRCLQLNTTQLDALFRKAKQKALIEDLHFHDTRHTAITRLAKKLDVLPLARIVGHKDLRQLMVYYNESAETLAQQLA